MTDSQALLTRRPCRLAGLADQRIVVVVALPTRRPQARHVLAEGRDDGQGRPAPAGLRSRRSAMESGLRCAGRTWTTR
jgi:hypothetical protein